MVMIMMQAFPDAAVRRDVSTVGYSSPGPLPPSFNLTQTLTLTQSRIEVRPTRCHAQVRWTPPLPLASVALARR